MKLIIVFLLLLFATDADERTRVSCTKQNAEQKKKNAKHEIIFPFFFVGLMVLWCRCDVKCISYDARDL